MGDTGIITDATVLLSNDLVATYGGFTYECWFKWNGAGVVNSVIDYAGTEKIVVDVNTGDVDGNRTVEMRWNSNAGLDVTVGGTGGYFIVKRTAERGSIKIEEVANAVPSATVNILSDPSKYRPMRPTECNRSAQR